MRIWVPSRRADDGGKETTAVPRGDEKKDCTNTDSESCGGASMVLNWGSYG